MNWEQFHFFKEPHGLSKNDSLEMVVCFDYEQALECKALVKLVRGLNDQQREHMLSQALRYRTSQFVPLDAGPIPLVEGVCSPAFQSSKACSFLSVPVACVAASWFPKHWLCAPPSERRRVTDRIKSLYFRRSIPIFDFPTDGDTIEILRRSAAEDGHTTLHVIAIDRSQTKSALVQTFEAWIHKQKDITGTLSRKGKVNIPAKLTDLGCFRLSTLDSVSRETAMEEAGFYRSVAKLSAAKRRAERRLKSLNYI